MPSIPMVSEFGAVVFLDERGLEEMGLSPAPANKKVTTS